MWIALNYYNGEWDKVSAYCFYARKRDEAAIDAGTFGTAIWVKFFNPVDQELFIDLIRQAGFEYMTRNEPSWSVRIHDKKLIDLEEVTCIQR